MIVRLVAPWTATAAVLAVLPAIFRSGAAISMMSLMGIMIILALSYNLLFGRTGMLSFGQAVYSGLGGFIAVHVLRLARAQGIAIPAVLFPLIGGVGGLLAAAATGWFATRRSGTGFAMITLGISELVSAMSMIMTGFFGGEDGLTIDRTRLAPFFGYRFGPAIQVYYLIAAWCFVCMAAIYAVERTPFGMACSAVRDNAERAAFIGYNPAAVRLMAFCMAGFFAGIAGGLSVIDFEIINATNLDIGQSGGMLLMTYIGGTGTFAGPIIGAILITLLRNMLSDYTDAWLMYYGILFILMVMYLPDGLAGLAMRHFHLVRSGEIVKLLPSYALVIWPLALAALGGILLIELSYHVLSSLPHASPRFRFFTAAVDGGDIVPWLLGIAALLGGGMVLRLVWPRVAAAWNAAI